MIRERVAPDGTCRPLEPESELGAATMPEDEVGTIKEGPAIRYLNGQALWDKKFGHAIKSVAKHRRRNLENAKKVDAGKIAHMWQEKVRRHREENERHENGQMGTEWEPDGESENRDHMSLLDQSWSWSWAMKGEAPPPSAIVSRRDYVSLSRTLMQQC